MMAKLTLKRLTRDSREYGSISFSDGKSGNWGRDVDGSLFLVVGTRSSKVRYGPRLSLVKDKLCEQFPWDCPECRPTTMDGE